MKQQINYLYCLTFPNGKKYIGQSNRPDRRFREHLRNAERELPYNLYKAIRKHGPPTMNILCASSPAYVSALEIKAIEAFGARDLRFGYNICVGGDAPNLGRKGQIRSLEARAKISAALKGKEKSPEHRANLSAAHKGRTPSPEQRAKMSDAAQRREPMSAETRAKLSVLNQGKRLSPETRAKLSAAAQRREPMSAETRAKISAAGKGRPGPNKGRTFPPEVRAKISAVSKGRGKGKTHSPETRAKISANRKGKPAWNKDMPWSAEVRAKLSVITKAQWVQRRSLSSSLVMEGTTNG